MKDRIKTEGLIMLEESIRKYPHNYVVGRDSEGSLVTAEHLDSGMLYRVIEKENYLALIYIS